MCAFFNRQRSIWHKATLFSLRILANLSCCQFILGRTPIFSRGFKKKIRNVRSKPHFTFGRNRNGPKSAVRQIRECRVLSILLDNLVTDQEKVSPLGHGFR